MERSFKRYRRRLKKKVDTEVTEPPTEINTGEDSLYWEGDVAILTPTPTPEPENNIEPIREVPRLPMVGLKTFQRNVRNSKRRNF